MRRIAEAVAMSSQKKSTHEQEGSSSVKRKKNELMIFVKVCLMF